MSSYEDLVELARICLRQARLTENPATAAELRRMAEDYRRRAAAVDHNAGIAPARCVPAARS